MPTRILTESDVDQLLSMSDCIQAVREALLQLAAGQAANNPRSRVAAPGILLHTMSASAEYLGVIGWKNYTSTRDQIRFHVGLYDSTSGALMALIQADRLGQLRTGAATGVASAALAAEQLEQVGLIGTGLQAATQLLAVDTVHQIDRVHIFGRDRERRERFVATHQPHVRTQLVAVESASAACRDSEVVITATTSREPVLKAEDLKPGTVVHAMGSNFRKKRELDLDVFERSTQVIADDVAQCQIEAGELIAAAEAGLLDWDQVVPLGSLLAGNATGRVPAADGDLTIFKSVGLAVEDIAVAKRVFDRAVKEDIGTLAEL